MREKILQALGYTPSDPDCITVSGKTVTIRKSYYWRSQKPLEDIFSSIEEKLTEAGIKITSIEYGDKYKPFKGGASVKENSHYFMKFKVA